MESCLRCSREFKPILTDRGRYIGYYCPVCHYDTMSENEKENTITFEDEGALDTFIVMAGLSEEAAKTLRRGVEEHGYGEPIELPEEAER